MSGKIDKSIHRGPVRIKRISFLKNELEVLSARDISHNFSKHMHEDYAVGIIESGAMGFRYRGADLVASKGLINLVVPGEVHDGHPVSEKGWSYRMFYLPPQLLHRAAKEISPGAAKPHFRAGVLDDSELARQILRVHHNLDQNKSSSLENDTLLLKLLINWISRHADHSCALSATGSEHNAVQLAREYMEDCYAKDITLEQLAVLCGLSPYYFIRVFEKHTGITPHAYLTQARVNRAKEKLVSPLRLADIAAECGFFDQSHLTRLFRKQFGITPGRYRNFIQNNK